jgi:hypothetical protein
MPGLIQPMLEADLSVRRSSRAQGALAPILRL